MWDTIKQQQLNELLQREQETALTDGERRTLEQLLYELEQEEWNSLRPALDRMRQEQAQLQEKRASLQTQNALLAALAERQTDLLARARVQLASLLSEHALLKSEYERALSNGQSGA
ncbi:MAG: hypothetical protein L0229_10655 [Blastocatellia bacterium]|nr:hypothetical protein [Blastocatellia bacterium]